MIAGTLALLEEPADEPLEDYHDSGGRVVEVEASHSYLDGYRVQSGRIAGDVSVQEQRVTTTGGEIDVEQRNTRRKAVSEFIADVQHQGWVLCERTWATDEEHVPDWPFSDLQRLTGQTIEPMGLDPAEFVGNQTDDDRYPALEMTAIESANGTRIDWSHGEISEGKRANVGTALRVRWGSTHVRLVMYASGYMAIWEPSDWEPEQVGRFVAEEIVPVAVSLNEDEEQSQQTEVTA